MRCLVLKIACFGVRLGLSVERPLEELLVINVPWLEGLLVLSPVLGSPISGVKAQPLSVAPRCHRPHSTAHKPPRLMVKPHPKKLTIFILCTNFYTIQFLYKLILKFVKDLECPMEKEMATHSSILA